MNKLQHILDLEAKAKDRRISNANAADYGRYVILDSILIEFDTVSRNNIRQIIETLLMAEEALSIAYDKMTYFGKTATAEQVTQALTAISKLKDGE